MSTKYARQKAKYWGAPVPNHMQHGVQSHARKVYGCTCADCRPEVVRPGRTPGVERNRKLRAAKQGTSVPEGRRHSLYTYRIYACRCDICLAAKAATRAEESNAWRARATGRWDERADGMTVLHWPPVGHGVWTCPDCGLQLRHRPRKEWTLAA